ncbi:MAG TPA: GNAT family N-acetyltransferase [Fimbriimonadaceae bacterium]|nr:GNAT family N-acetyltransferase [Fimbriimonadaceae bacterium]
MDFVVREAEPSDAPAVVAVVKAVFDEYGFTWDQADYHADLYDLQAHYFERGLPFWVAEDTAGVVGTASLGLFDIVPGSPGQMVEHEGQRRIGGCDCSLERLYVHPIGRRRGIGRALFEAVCAEARLRKRSLMEIWSDKRFQDAHRLYQRYGAEVAGDRICHDPDQSPEWGLYLPLREGSKTEKTS